MASLNSLPLLSDGSVPFINFVLAFIHYNNSTTGYKGSIANEVRGGNNRG
jgi:hypothetical protein